MAHETHTSHTHQHGDGCGHTVVMHDGHRDYLHDGRMHFLHDGHVDEHRLDVSGRNPADCTPKHNCGAHDATHVHGPTCGHEPVPHGEHVDYLVMGHVHHPHGSHCDDHGSLAVQ